MIHNSFDELGLVPQAKYQRGWWPLIAAGAAIIGDVWRNEENKKNMERQNQLNREAAERQMQFQKEMSDTGHQREVEDLVKAGINPTMSAGGSGASTPSGASGDMEMPEVQLPDVFQAVSLMQEQQKINLMGEQVPGKKGLVSSQKDLTDVKTRLAKKGIIRADLEGEASQILKNIINYWKRNPKSKIPLKDLRGGAHFGADPRENTQEQIDNWRY